MGQKAQLHDGPSWINVQLQIINHFTCVHLFTGQSDHVQGAIHEATDQCLGSVLSGDDIIHPVVGSDVLQCGEEQSEHITRHSWVSTLSSQGFKRISARNREEKVERTAVGKANALKAPYYAIYHYSLSLMCL